MIGTVENPVVLQQYGTFENNYSMVWVGRWVGVGSSDNKTFSNDKFKHGTGSAVSVAGMTGSAAKANMPGFNFADKDNINAETKPIWYLSPGNTPKLYKFCRTELDLTEPVFENGTITRRIASQVAIAIEWPKAVDVQYTPGEFINYTVYWSKDIITSANVGSANVGGSFVGVTGATISSFSLGDEIYFAVAATDQGGDMLDKSQKKQPYVFKDITNLNDEYHTYGFEWTPEYMEMSVDGEVYCTYDINSNFDGHSDMSGFHDALYVLFNNHIFTENSEWLPKGTPQVDERTDFPIHYWIDYIRLYQKDEYGDLYLA